MSKSAIILLASAVSLIREAAEEIRNGTRVEFDSSSLLYGRFEPEWNILTIEFQTGGVYVYYAVPESVWEGLLAAESAGKYFAANIRDKYPYTDVKKA